MSSRDDAVTGSRRAGSPAATSRSAASPPADLRALFNATPTPLLVLALPDWTVVAANDARLSVTGTTRDEQIGRRLFDPFPDDPEDPNADGVRNLSASLERVVATRATDTMAIQRYAVRGPDGRFVERWWGPINKPVLGADGEVVLVIHHVEDVTEVVRLRGDAEGRDQLVRGQQVLIDCLRTSEAALRESEARLSRALLASRLAAFEWEVDTGRVELDARGRELFGFAPGEKLMAGEVFSRIHADDLPRVRAAADAAVAAAGSRLEIEYRVIRPDRTVLDLASLGDAEPGPDGRAARMRDVFADVTERRRAEAALRELNETLERRVEERAAAFRLYEHIVQSDRSPVVAFDHGGRLTAFNRAHEEAFLRVFGRGAQVGDMLADFFPPD